jgi:hypothetical protein
MAMLLPPISLNLTFPLQTDIIVEGASGPFVGPHNISNLSRNLKGDFHVL